MVARFSLSSRKNDVACESIAYSGHPSGSMSSTSSNFSTNTSEEDKLSSHLNWFNMCSACSHKDAGSRKMAHVP